MLSMDGTLKVIGTLRKAIKAVPLSATWLLTPTVSFSVSQRILQCHTEPLSLCCAFHLTVCALFSGLTPLSQWSYRPVCLSYHVTLGFPSPTLFTLALPTYQTLG